MSSPAQAAKAAKSENKVTNSRPPKEEKKDVKATRAEAKGASQRSKKSKESSNKPNQRLTVGDCTRSNQLVRRYVEFARTMLKMCEAAEGKGASSDAALTLELATVAKAFYYTERQKTPGNRGVTEATPSKGKQQPPPKKALSKHSASPHVTASQYLHGHFNFKDVVVSDGKGEKKSHSLPKDAFPLRDSLLLAEWKLFLEKIPKKDSNHIGPFLQSIKQEMNVKRSNTSPAAAARALPPNTDVKKLAKELSDKVPTQAKHISGRIGLSEIYFYLMYTKHEKESKLFGNRGVMANLLSLYGSLEHVSKDVLSALYKTEEFHQLCSKLPDVPEEAMKAWTATPFWTRVSNYGIFRPKQILLALLDRTDQSDGLAEKATAVFNTPYWGRHFVSPNPAHSQKDSKGKDRKERKGQVTRTRSSSPPSEENTPPTAPVKQKIVSLEPLHLVPAASAAAKKLEEKPEKTPKSGSSPASPSQSSRKAPTEPAGVRRKSASTTGSEDSKLEGYPSTSEFANHYDPRTKPLTKFASKSSFKTFLKQLNEGGRNYTPVYP
jgi:hypothetical protein